tara:strand:- start:79 stop:654 length:576 start_codon:yes stop_codon:yes gene_type:complete
MVIAEIALGLKLANDAVTLGKSAVEGCAKVINNCKDPSEISGHLDQLFKAQYDLEQQNKKNKGNTAYGTYLKSKLSDGDEAVGESISDVTAEVIHEKQLQEQIAAMARMLNRRFGPDTWDDILDLREERQKENKIKRKKAKEKFLEKQEQTRKLTKKVLAGIWQTIVVTTAIVGLWWWLSYLITCAGSCFK